jgi:uncharacterized protein (DUF952 family)
LPADWIVHLCERSAWEQALASGEYRSASLLSQGFIHASRPQQLLNVANRFYPGAMNLLILWIDPRKLRSPLRWETAEGELFPHIYGPLNLEAVSAVFDFPPGADGAFHRLPGLGL